MHILIHTFVIFVRPQKVFEIDILPFAGQIIGYIQILFRIILKLINANFEFFKTMSSLVPRSQKPPLGFEYFLLDYVCSLSSTIKLV
jgi:hypothetical protein